MLRLQVRKEFVHRHCIQLLGVVVGYGGDDGAVGGCGASGGCGADARVGVDDAEFLANVVCLGENDLRVDDRTPKSFLALEGQDRLS